MKKPISDLNRRDNSKIELREKGKIRLIERDKITYLICDGYLTTVYTSDNNQFTVCKLLKQFETELYEFGFIRLNYNTIVNMKYVCEIQTTPERIIILKNNTQITVSRRRKYLLKEYFAKNQGLVMY